jgi:hypothetical protein
VVVRATGAEGGHWITFSSNGPGIVSNRKTSIYPYIKSKRIVLDVEAGVCILQLKGCRYTDKEGDLDNLR